MVSSSRLYALQHISFHLSCYSYKELIDGFFLLDSTELVVVLSTNSPTVTKQSYINVIVEFNKPVFGFDDSNVEVEGGRVARQVHRPTPKSTEKI